MEQDTRLDRSKTLDSTGQSFQDARDLALMGHDQGLTRKFGTWSMLSLAFCVLGTWSTFAQDLGSGLTSGGAITILWGLVLVLACNLCIAVSLGELCSSMPTALGQAYYVHRLWKTPTGRFVSYLCAWINVFGWWTLTASQVAFMTNFILGIKLMFNPDWTGDAGWLKFIVYIGIVLLFTVSNLVACRKDQVLPYFNNIVGVQFTTLFFVFSLAMLISVGVRSNLSFQPASFAFGKWLNETGWSDGVVWFIGLVQAAYGLTAMDSVIHMTEELPNPRTNAPRAIWLAVLLGAITGFLFMVVCLFCIQNLDDTINSPTGLPFLQLVQDTVGLQGAAALIVLFIFNGLGQGISVATTASRLTWGFARDGGLPWSNYLARVNKTWKVPPQALWAQGILIGVIGVLYLFANTVLEAILSVSTIALTVSYGLPIAVLLAVGRDKLPPGGTFKLGRWGAPVNYISVIYCCITTVFFFFPTYPDPSASDMNYAIAVFGVMLVVSLFFWVVKGRKTYLQTDEAKVHVLEATKIEEDIAMQNVTAFDDRKIGNGHVA
ncbi:hypothetical protein MBLNU459_g0738t1 [Dothideomycetes sp. NU459]